MPPRGRKAKAARQAERRVEEAPKPDRLVEDDSSDDDDNDGDDKARDARRRAKAVRDQKATKREEHMKLVTDLREEGLEKFAESGMVRSTTEGFGDCWLIAILAGHELESALVKSLSPEQRKEKLTPWRIKLSEFAPHMDTKGTTLSGEMLGLEYLKQVARLFQVEESVIESCERTKSWKKTRDSISKKLQAWKKPLYFGTYQEPVHVCMGLMLHKNILEIDIESISKVSTCMLRAPLLLPVRRCKHAMFCVHACVHRLLQRVDAVGVEWQANDHARERRRSHRPGCQPSLPRLEEHDRIQ